MSVHPSNVLNMWQLKLDELSNTQCWSLVKNSTEIFHPLFSAIVPTNLRLRWPLDRRLLPTANKPPSSFVLPLSVMMTLAPVFASECVCICTAQATNISAPPLSSRFEQFIYSPLSQPNETLSQIAVVCIILQPQRGNYSSLLTCAAHA